MKPWVLFILLVYQSLGLLAQPVNNLWRNAMLIDGFDNGYTDGNFRSKAVSLEKANVQPREYFSNEMVFLRLDQKSVWFKIELKTTKDVEIGLRQSDTLIDPKNLGLCVYKANKKNSIPGAYDVYFPILTQQGSVSKKCLEKGVYYIQVCATQKAVDSIFIEVNVALGSINGNVPETAVLANSQSSNFFENACFSIASLNELKPYSNQYFNQSIYLYFNTQTAARSILGFSGKWFSATVYKGLPSQKYNWQFLYERKNISTSTIDLVDTFLCKPFFEDSTGFIIKILLNDTISKFNLIGPSFKSYNQSTLNNPNNAYANIPEIEGTEVYKTFVKRDNITCNLGGTEYLCKSHFHLLVDTIKENMTTGKFVVDTINMGSWITFTLEKSSEIQYSFTGPRLGYGSVRRLQAWLFTGEYINAMCKSKPISLQSGKKLCLQAGTYTIFNGYFANNKSFNNISYNSNIGSELIFTLEVVSKYGVNGEASKYSKPSFPAKMPGFVANVETEQKQTAIDWLNAPLDSFEIDGTKYLGHFSFTTIELANNAFLKVWKTNGYNESYRIFKGDCSLGLNNLEDDVHSFVGTNENQATKELAKLEKGVYTLMSYRTPTDICNPPKAHNSSYMVLATTKNDTETKENEPCVANYYNAKIAGKINNGKPLFWNQNPINGISTFSIPNTCLKKVNNNRNLHLYNAKELLNKGDKLLYYEFELIENANIWVSTNNAFQLLKGSISNDSSIVKNAENVISTFEKGTMVKYCRFKKGIYSIIIIVSKTSFNGSIKVAQFVPTKNTSTRASVDLGIINSDNPVVKTQTNANCYLIENKNSIYYTIRITERGKLDLVELNGIRLIYILYKSTRAKGQIFEQLKKLSLVDSLGLPTIFLPKRINGTRTYLIEEMDTGRYYFYLTGLSLEQQIDFELRFEADSKNTPLGDFCSNAITDTLNNLGSVALQAWTSSHSLGEGPHEQENTMLCSRGGTVFGLKTSWFKLVVRNNAGNTVQIIPSQNAVETKMYYGSCGALTPASCISKGGQVKFFCAADGEYYFQVFSDITDWSYVGLEVTAIQNQDPCKMVDIEAVFANFYYTGGCDKTPSSFFNYSTFGSDVAYKWNFGDGAISSLTNPTHRFITTSTKDSSLVSLVVKNTLTNRSDSLAKWVYYYLDDNKFDLDTFVCADTISFGISKQFNISWAPQTAEIGNGDTFIFFNPTSFVNRAKFSRQSINPYLVRVYKSNDKCNFLDTISLDFASYAFAKANIAICNEKADTIEIKKPFWANNIRWCNGDTTWIKIVTEAEKCLVQISGKKCVIEEEIVIQKYTRPVYYLSDTFCLNSKLNFKDLTNVFELTKINNTQAKIYNTQKSDSIVYLTWKSKNAECVVKDTAHLNNFYAYSSNLRDTTFCQGQKLVLVAGKPGVNYTWNHGKIGRKVGLDSVGFYTLTAESKNCIYQDSFMLSQIKNPIKNLSDTQVCSFENAIFIELLPADHYKWSNGNVGQSISITDTGLFWVNAQIKHCVFSDTFQVTQDCPSTLYIPNAFTPGKDDINPVFLPKGTEISNYVMRIYAQTGQIVFYSKELNSGWDGTIKGEMAPIGTYFYLIEYNHNGERKQSQGNLTLIR